MTDKEQELNKKLAKWRYPNAVRVEVDDEHILVVFRHGNKVTRLYTRSLDACFKGLVPSVFIRYAYVKTFELLRGWIDGLLDVGDGLCHSPALALCLAIEKLIDGG